MSLKVKLDGHDAPMEVVDGGKMSMQLADLDNNGLSGGFFHQSESLLWYIS